MRVRSFRRSDTEVLVTILKLNKQYSYPDIEGPEAMLRVSRCKAALFLVAERNGRPIGFIKGVYDGSRALIHLLSVHPDFQRNGVGSRLLEEAVLRFKKMRAPSVSVLVVEESKGFWEKKAFKRLPVFLMLKPVPEPS